jgi:hypothetical protein
MATKVSCPVLAGLPEWLSIWWLGMPATDGQLVVAGEACEQSSTHRARRSDAPAQFQGEGSHEKI